MASAEVVEYLIFYISHCLNFSDACLRGCGPVDDLAELCIVGLVEDDGLYLLLRLLADVPRIALGIDGQRRVVIQVVQLSSVAVVLEDVAAGVVALVALGHVGTAQVHVLAADDGDAPQRALNVVAANHGAGLAVGVVEADAAAAVHGIGLVLVVAQRVVLHRQFGDGAHDADAVAVVGNGAAADEHLGVKAHEIGDADAAHHVVRRIARHGAARNLQALGGGDVDLRHVAVGGGVLHQHAVLDGERLRGVGGTAYRRLAATLEVAVLHDAGGPCRDEVEGSSRRAVMVQETAVAHVHGPLAHQLYADGAELAVLELRGAFALDADGESRPVLLGGWLEDGEVRLPEVGLALDGQLHVRCQAYRRAVVHAPRVALGNGDAVDDLIAVGILLDTRAGYLRQRLKRVRPAVACRRVLVGHGPLGAEQQGG